MLRLARALRSTLAVSAFVLGGLAQAQTGTIKLMVGFPAGGGTDAIAVFMSKPTTRLFVNAHKN